MKAWIALAALAALAGCAPAADSGAGDKAATAEIRAAEARLIAHLEGSDPMAWVGDYTTDAVFQEGEDTPVSGRAALTDLARSLGPLSGAAIVPVRTLVRETSPTSRSAPLTLSAREPPPARSAITAA
jgi:hypothetical protein